MLLSRLNESEKNMVAHWIDDYAGGPYNKERAGIDRLLQYWNRNKVGLYNLFGQELILSKQVEIEKPAKEMEDEIYSSFNGYGAYIGMEQFYRSFHSWYYDLPQRIWELSYLMDIDCLVRNEYKGDTFEIPMPDNKKLKVQAGTKPLRIFAKLAKAYNLEGFEEFRLAHSRILNQKKVTGELCLSIHPMDYMTMSDNECDWDSCMSWRNDGCYRRGTVEMMNSKYVVVAYLKAKEDMRYYDWEWSNKKWRMLIIVDSDCIAGVKGYPYQNDELTQICLNWLADLAEKNEGWEYFSENIAYDYYDVLKPEGGRIEGYKVCFETDYMYNDFDTCTHWIRVGKSADARIFIPYSGEASCMFCGEVHGYEDEDEACSLVCERCWDTAYCACCEGRYERSEMHIVDDEYVCGYCYDEHVEECPITNREHLENDMHRLYLASGAEPNYAEDTYIKVYMSDLRYGNFDELLDKYFPKRELNPSHAYHIFHYDSRNWEDIYYVRIDECSKEGLTLFGIESEEDLKDYRSKSPNSILDIFGE